MTMLIKATISVALFFSRAWVVECWLPATLYNRTTGDKRKTSSIAMLPVASVVSFGAALQLSLIGITVLPANASEDFFFQNQMSPRQERALRDLKDLKTLQDSRLDICVGKLGIP